MKTAAGYLAVLTLAVAQASAQDRPQTAIQVRVEPFCAITGIQHVFGPEQAGVRSGVTRFRLLLRTSRGIGSASLTAAFDPAGTRDATVNFKTTLAGNGLEPKQGVVKSGPTVELAAFPANTRSPREGLTGEIVWSYTAGPDLPVMPGGEPSLTVVCR